MQEYFKKNWSTLLLGAFLVLMLIPQTRQPIQVLIQRMIALSPNTIEQENQIKLEDYNLIYETSDQNKLNLIEHKNEVVLINFWATWCPPCIAEMPSFQKLYADYQDKITFLFITQDEWDIIENFEDKRNFNLPYFRLINANKQLNYQKLPTTYLIDKNGNIVLEHIGVADWNSDSFREKLDQIIQE